MLTIIAGHIFGMLIPLFIWTDIKLIASDPGGKVPVYLLLLGLVLFLEYQLVRSIRDGKLYFRGTIDESDSTAFKTCQFTYALQGGFLSVVFLQNLLS